MIPIEVDAHSQAQGDEDVKIHFLPVKIARDGKANVSKFFLIEEDKEVLLKGRSITVTAFQLFLRSINIESKFSRTSIARSDSICACRLQRIHLQRRRA
jgi:hypothetical protein